MVSISSIGLLSMTTLIRVIPSSTSASPLRLAPAQPLVKFRAVTSCTASQTQTQPATGKQPRGLLKPKRVSPEMQALIGLEEISRAEALKRIWAYIKGNNLQDPGNKKIIVCDEKLKTIFAGKDRVGFLEVAKLINPHFLK